MDERKGIKNEENKMSKDGNLATHNLPETGYVACPRATSYLYINIVRRHIE